MRKRKAGVTKVLREREDRSRGRGLEIIDQLDHGQRAALNQRLVLALATLGGETGAKAVSDPADLIQALGQALKGDASRVWLAWSVLAGSLQTIDQARVATCAATLDGPWTALVPALRILARTHGPLPRVEVASGQITCDIHSTARTDFLSGIQRVVRNVSRQWKEQHPEVRFVGWTDELGALADLPAEDAERVFGVESGVGGATEPHTVIVPWQGIHLIPELPAEPQRIARIAAIGRYSGCRVGIIGYDVIPLTMAGSVPAGLVSGFARHLASCRDVDRIAAISASAASEYIGWKGMLAGVSAEGPRVAAVPLPVSAQDSDATAMDRARITLGVTTEPMFLVVGSHEPRKNHLAVLHAAELLWREGHRFTLTMVGAGAWREEGFGQRVEALQAAGRPVHTARGLPDAEMWAGIRMARCSIFPSLNEGYGLPVAESLAVGTPVITSDFGSMKEIVAPDGIALGGLLIDPRDDYSLRDAMRTMLTDETTYERLKAETAEHQLGTWDDYSRAVWKVLVSDH